MCRVQSMTLHLNVFNCRLDSTHVNMVMSHWPPASNGKCILGPLFPSSWLSLIVVYRIVAHGHNWSSKSRWWVHGVEKPLLSDYCLHPQVASTDRNVHGLWWFNYLFSLSLKRFSQKFIERIVLRKHGHTLMRKNMVQRCHSCFHFCCFFGVAVQSRCGDGNVLWPQKP